MRRILRENLWMIVTIGVFVLIVTTAKVGWGQGPPKQLTPDQTIEAAVIGMLNWKLKYGKETVFAAEMQGAALRAEQTVKKLRKQLKKSNAELAQCKMKPEEEKDEKPPDNGAVD